MNGISETQIAYTGYFNEELIKGLKSGKISCWNEEEIIKKKFDKERQRIQPTYNSNGKLIEYDDSGRHLDFIV
jgi:hypothetical protein